MDKPELRDELYSQLFRQTIDNPVRESVDQTFDLIVICCSLFPPSADMLNYVAGELMRAGRENPLLAVRANFALKRLQRTVRNGARRLAPSDTELSSLRAQSDIICKVFFADEAGRAVFADSAMTSQELLLILANKIGLRDPSGYALYEVYNRLERSLPSNGKVADALARAERLHENLSQLESGVGAFDWRLMFKKRTNVDGGTLYDDPIGNTLLFHQYRREILAGSIPCTVREAVELGAIMLQLDVGNFDPGRNLQDLLPKLIPKRLARDLSSNEWCRAIAEEHSRYEDRTPDESVLLFLHRFARLPYEGSTIFTVSLVSADLSTSLPPEFEIAVSHEGVKFYLLEVNRLLRLIPFHFLNSTCVSTTDPPVLQLAFTEEGTERVLEVSCRGAADLCSLVDEYKVLSQFSYFDLQLSQLSCP